MSFAVTQLTFSELVQPALMLCRVITQPCSIFACDLLENYKNRMVTRRPSSNTGVARGAINLHDSLFYTVAHLCNRTHIHIDTQAS